MSIDWSDVKCKRISLDSYKSEDDLNKILQLQDDCEEDFAIQDIQIINASGYERAWIFYTGEYPEPKPKPEPKPQPPRITKTHGTLPAGMKIPEAKK